MITQKTRSESGQLSLQFPPELPRVSVLTYRQVKERFGNLLNLREIEVRKYAECKNFRILHKGRDRWEVIRID